MWIEMARFLIVISIKQWEVKYILVKLFISDSKMRKELNLSKNAYSISAGWKPKEKVNTAQRIKLFKMKKLKCIIKDYMKDAEMKHGLNLFII